MWGKSKISKHYDKYHTEYLKYYGSTIQAHRPQNEGELLEYLYNEIGVSDNEKILDAGCGICGPAIYFAKKNQITIEAITISPKQYETAKVNIAEHNLNTKINITLGNFHKIHKLYPENYFDKILFLESFGHSTQIKFLLNISYKALKPGGILFIKDYFKKTSPSSQSDSAIKNTAIRRLKKHYCYHLYILADVLAIAESIGFHTSLIKTPDIILSNENVVNAFEKANQIKLYDNDNQPVIVDPIIIKLTKPHK